MLHRPRLTNVKAKIFKKVIGTGKFFLEGQVSEEEAKKLVKKTIKRL